MGTDTSYVVQYGTSTNYGATTASKMVRAGGTPVAIAAAVGGLKPGTLYHYRVVAANARGTINGADATFTTARGSSAGGGGTPRDTSAPKLAVATPAKPAAADKGPPRRSRSAARWPRRSVATARSGWRRSRR